MNSVCILLTDHESINEDIIILSYKYLLKVELKNLFYRIKKNFRKIYKNLIKKKKFKFMNVELEKNNFLNILNQ